MLIRNYEDLERRRVQLTRIERIDQERKTKLAAALLACDEISGIFYAYRKLNPVRYGEMKASSIKKVRGVPPFFFLKPPSTVLSGPGPTVFMPRDCKNLDWEAEMVVVFGKGGKDITPERALEHVAGYTLGIDFTARDLFSAPDSFFKFNFVLGKCQDTLSPVGPAIVPAAFADGEDLHFSLSVNGVKKQSTSTRNMIYSLAEQIAGVSRGVRIEAGDLMFTGSPAGVGLPRGEKLAPGE